MYSKINHLSFATLIGIQESTRVNVPRKRSTLMGCTYQRFSKSCG